MSVTDLPSMQVVLPHARALGNELVRELVRVGARAEIVGETRLGHELVSELTFVCDLAPSEAMAALEAPDLTLETEVGGLRGTLALEHGDLPIRVRCTSSRGYIEALIRHSSTDAHLQALDAHARRRGTTVSDVAFSSADEQAFYAALGLPYPTPELRDSATLDVPSLIDSVAGVFHVHTAWSDGVDSIIAMARAAHARGFSYLGISDHSRAAHYANGLDIDRLLDQRRDIARARREVPEMAIFHGIEVDVLPDGTLDLPDVVLAKLDFVVASVHSDLHLSRDEQTRRVVRALGHPLVTILGHPTGRLLLGRPGIELDLETVARAAAEHGVLLEINTTAQRLDLCADDIQIAARLGASFAIDPDAHEPAGFDMVPFGVLLARRARLSPDRVLNTRNAEQVGLYLAARRERAIQALGVA